MMRAENTQPKFHKNPNTTSKSEKPEGDNLEIKWQTLASYLERDGAPLGETDLTLTVYGIHSIPEEWIKLENSGSCDNWPWQVKCSDIQLDAGKFYPKEMTEDEKKEQENKKKPKTTGKKVEEPSQEEKEKMLKELHDKEERERKFREVYDALDEKGKFYMMKELPTEESWIAFPTKSGTDKKVGEKLIIIEEEINEDGKLFLEVLKVPPPDYDEKKRPKPKGISPDEVKPVICCAVLDMSYFKLNPGEKEIEIRAPLMLQETYERRQKRDVTIINDDEEIANYDKNVISTQPKVTSPVSNVVVNKDNLLSDEDYVEKNKTYIYLKLSFSKPINPPVPEVPLPSIKELLKREEKIAKPITAEEVCNDFRRQLKIAIEAICKDYVNHIGDAKTTAKKENSKGKTGQNKTDKINERDASINSFLFAFNISKKADILKEKLKRFIVRIVREKWGKREKITKVFKDSRDQFYSELYSYLCEEVKLSMDEFITKKKDELHENIITSYLQSREEVKNYAKQINNESEDKRLIRLSKEYEIMGDYSQSLYYFKCSLTLNKSKEAWLNYAKLNKKIGNLYEMEEAIISCINENLQSSAVTSKAEARGQNNLNTSSNTIKQQPLSQSLIKEATKERKQFSSDMQINLLFASIKFIKGNYDYSINFMAKIIKEQGIKHTGICFNALLSMFYYEKSKDKEDPLYRKHKEVFKRFLLREKYPVAISKKPKNYKYNVSDDYIESLIEESIFFYIDDFFNAYHLYEISEKLMDLFVTNKNSSKYLLLMAKINLEYKRYDLCINQATELINREMKYNQANSAQNHMYSKVAASYEEAAKSSSQPTKVPAVNNPKDKKKDQADESPVVVPQTIQNKENNIPLNEPYILRGHAYYMQNNLFNSAEDYVKAIRKKKDKDKRFDIIMLFRLGITFVKRQTWDDSRTVFLEILKNSNESQHKGDSLVVKSELYAFAWRYLGLACLRLEDYEAAEEALSQANLLDFENSTTWSYLTIFCLKVNRKNQALECLNELLKLQYRDTETLIEISKLFEAIGEYRIASDIYSKLLEFNPKNFEVTYLLGDLFFHHLDKKEQSKTILRNFRDMHANEDQKIKIGILLEKIEDKVPYYEKNYEENSIHSKNEEFLEENNREGDSGEYIDDIEQDF